MDALDGLAERGVDARDPLLLGGRDGSRRLGGEPLELDDHARHPVGDEEHDERDERGVDREDRDPARDGAPADAHALEPRADGLEDVGHDERQEEREEDATEEEEDREREPAEDAQEEQAVALADRGFPLVDDGRGFGGLFGRVGHVGSRGEAKLLELRAN